MTLQNWNFDDLWWHKSEGSSSLKQETVPSEEHQDAIHYWWSAAQSEARKLLSSPPDSYAMKADSIERGMIDEANQFWISLLNEWMNK